MNIGNVAINIILAKVCFFIAIICAVIATFGQALGAVNPGWLAIVFVAGGLLLA